MAIVFEQTKGLTDKPLHYCPGCTHGIAHRLIAEVMCEMGILEEDVWWYLETRKFGTAPHSGFGLGFERLVLFVTGMANIRDVIPFPRTPNNAEF